MHWAWLGVLIVRNWLTGLGAALSFAVSCFDRCWKMFIAIVFSMRMVLIDFCLLSILVMAFVIGPVRSIILKSGDCF